MRLAVVASAVLCLGMPGAAEQRAPRLNLAIDGNSLSIAVNGVPSYATYLPFTSTNVALGGQTTRDMIESFGDVQAAFDPAARNILVAWEGTNDLYFGATPAQAVAHLETYRAAATGKGWEVIVLTLLPRASTPDPVAFERQRLAVNDGLRRARLPLVDVGADTEMGPFPAVLAGVYYQTDRVHLAERGSRRIAAAVTRAIHARLARR